MNGNLSFNFNMSFGSADAVNQYFSKSAPAPVQLPSPLPTAIWLVGSALAGLLGFVRRKRF
jgi:hypothetical protein